MPTTITATYDPGTTGPGTDFRCATVRYVVNDGTKRTAMFQSDLVVELVCHHHFTWAGAARIASDLWVQAEAAPDYTITVPW